NVPASPVTSTVELKKVNAAWGEGTSVASSGGGQGGAASTNDVTWTHRLFDTQNWSSPGGDFSSVVSSSVSISGLGTYEWPSTAQMVADVQGWLNDSSVNFGWIIIGDEVHNQSAKRFDSRTSLTEANRPVLTVGYSIPTSVQGNAVKPAQFVLEQNYPNPFNPTTTITYSVPQTGHVSMTVYDILGNNVATLVDQPKSAGTHSVKFDGSRLSNGVYFYRLRFGNVSAVKKLTLVK
ncbi:MAG: T9SS type A sorting domain-containing protein, partial [Bacteroidota bacterium]